MFKTRSRIKKPAVILAVIILYSLVLSFPGVAYAGDIEGPDQASALASTGIIGLVLGIGDEDTLPADSSGLIYQSNPPLCLMADDQDEVMFDFEIGDAVPVDSLGSTKSYVLRGLGISGFGVLYGGMIFYTQVSLK